jgi:hypothetical protein
MWNAALSAREVALTVGAFRALTVADHRPSQAGIQVAVG